MSKMHYFCKFSKIAKRWGSLPSAPFNLQYY